MARRQDPERRDPPVGWVRLRYTKLGPARFMSARDVARLLERALKRADVPVAYSSGFSPHMRVSYAFPAPTGAASLSEYALVALASALEPDVLQQRLGAQLPDGVRVWASATNDRHLPPLLAASRWRMTWPGTDDDGSLATAVASFLTADTVNVERRSKSGTSIQDVRGAVVSLEAGTSTAESALTMVLRQGDPLIRPTDVAAGLASWCQPMPVWGPGLLSREAQGTLEPDGTVTDLPEPDLRPLLG